MASDLVGKWTWHAERGSGHLNDIHIIMIDWKCPNYYQLTDMKNGRSR